MLYAVRSMHVLTGGLFPAIKEEKDGMSLAETLRSPLALTAKGITRFTQSLQEYEGEKNHRAPSTGKDKNRKPTAFRTMGRQSEEEADRRKFPRDFEGLMNERKERKGGKVIRKAKQEEEIEEDEDDDFDLKDFMSHDRDRATSRSPPSTPPRKRGGRATESNDSLLIDSSSRIDSRDSRATTSSSSSSFRDSLSGLSKRNSVVVNSVKGAGKEEPAAGRGRKGILPRPSRPAPRTMKAQDDDDDE